MNYSLQVSEENDTPIPFQALSATQQLTSRVGGGVPAESAPHACMILVNRVNPDGTGEAVLGSGSIISTRHVVTAAHLVEGNNINYQIGFIDGNNRRHHTATFRLIHEDYNSTDFSSDIALIFLRGDDRFPAANAIALTTDFDAPTNGRALKTAGYGLSSADSTGGTCDPYAADQHVASSCAFANFELTDTHFCAEDSSAATWVCPGDNGAGAFEAGETAAGNKLVNWPKLCQSFV